MYIRINTNYYFNLTITYNINLYVVYIKIYLKMTNLIKKY